MRKLYMFTFIGLVALGSLPAFADGGGHAGLTNSALEDGKESKRPEAPEGELDKGAPIDLDVLSPLADQLHQVDSELRGIRSYGKTGEQEAAALPAAE